MVAKVYINSVQVGSIPLEHYEKIKKFAYKDKKNYFLQTFNIIKVICNLAFKSVLFLPVFWFFILFYFISFAPNEVTQLIDFLKESSSEKITNFIRNLVSIGLLFSMLYIIIENVLLMKGFGYENAFKSSIERSVLHLLEIPERGNVFIQVEK